MAITIKSSTERALSYRRTPRKTEERLPENLFRHLAHLPPIQEGKIPALKRTFFYPGNYSESIKRFSPEQQKNIEDAIQALLLRGTLTKEEIEKAINLILLGINNETPKGDIKVLFQAAILSPSAPTLVLKIAQGSELSSCRVTSLMNAIVSLPEKEREKTIQRVLAVITDKKTPIELIPHLLELAAPDLDRISTFSPNVFNFALKMDYDFACLHDIIEAINSIPKEEREAVIQRILAVITEGTPKAVILNFLIIAPLSPSALNLALKASQDLHKSVSSFFANIHLVQFCSLQHTISSIPKEKREETIQRILAIITDKKTSLSLILDCFKIAPLSPSALNLALKIAQSKNVNEPYWTMLLQEIINSIPKEEREEVIKRTLAVITDEMPQRVITQFLRIAILSPSALKLALKIAQDLNRSASSSELAVETNLDFLQNAINSIPKEEREEVIQRTLAVITDEIPTLLISDLLQIAMLSPRGLNLALEMYKKRLPTEWFIKELSIFDGNDERLEFTLAKIKALLGTLKRIPKEHRDEVCKQLNEFSERLMEYPLLVSELVERRQEVSPHLFFGEENPGYNSKVSFPMAVARLLRMMPDTTNLQSPFLPPAEWIDLERRIRDRMAPTLNR